MEGNLEKTVGYTAGRLETDVPYAGSGSVREAWVRVCPILKIFPTLWTFIQK